MGDMRGSSETTKEKDGVCINEMKKGAGSQVKDEKEVKPADPQKAKPKVKVAVAERGEAHTFQVVKQVVDVVERPGAQKREDEG